MSCNCGCTNTTVNCTCPDPTGIDAAKLENIVSTTFSGGQDIYNAGAGYTHTLYTNTTSGSQIVYVQTNSRISCTTTHNVQTDYYVNAGAVGVTEYQDSASTNIDYTHFLVAVTVPPAGIVKLKFLSDNANGKLQWLVAFIYKYDV